MAGRIPPPRGIPSSAIRAGLPPLPPPPPPPRRSPTSGPLHADQHHHHHPHTGALSLSSPEISPQPNDVYDASPVRPKHPPPPPPSLHSSASSQASSHASSPSSPDLNHKRRGSATAGDKFGAGKQAPVGKSGTRQFSSSEFGVGDKSEDETPFAAPIASGFMQTRKFKPERDSGGAAAIKYATVGKNTGRRNSQLQLGRESSEPCSAESTAAADALFAEISGPPSSSDRLNYNGRDDFTNAIADDEKLAFSDEIMQLDTRRKGQLVDFVLTTQAIYLFESGRGEDLMRLSKLPLTDITRVLVSNFSDHFLVQSADIGLWLFTARRTKIVKSIAALALATLGKDLELAICTIEKIDEVYGLINESLEVKDGALKRQIKNIVRQKKIAYRDDKFDLDLCYITECIVAMGYPSEKLQGIYRNKYSDVYRFFELKHFEHYRVYNLCSERQYPLTYFGGCCAIYPFDDHTPPELKMIIDFCEDAASFIGQDAENVVAIHCKGGKGRTGTMVSCLLLRLGYFDDPEAAIGHFGQKRSADGKGITNPGQKRYVLYYSTLLRQNLADPLSFKQVGGSPFLLVGVKIYGLRGKMREAFAPSFVVKTPSGIVIFDVKEFNPVPDLVMTEQVKIDCLALVNGDVKIVFFNLAKNPTTEVEWASLFFNTTMMDKATTSIRFPRNEIDGPHKDKKNKKFAGDLAIELFFQDPSGDKKTPPPKGNSKNILPPQPHQGPGLQYSGF